MTNTTTIQNKEGRDGKPQNVLPGREELPNALPGRGKPRNAPQRQENPQNVPPKIKFCGLKRAEDIEMANALKIDYAGFVFAKKSRRYVPWELAEQLRGLLAPEIQAVGVFVNEDICSVAELIKRGIIDIVQLHGNEDEAYIRKLRELAACPVIKAFRIDSEEDCQKAQNSSADFVLLDSGSGGTGECFDWSMIRRMERPYFLAGGLDARNVRLAVEQLHPYALDVSSGIETDGKKDGAKMKEFANAVRCDIALA